MTSSLRSAFTLIELLVVIAVIAVLSVVVILVLNPTELLRQSRDSNRVSDLSTLKTAVAFYASQGGSAFGNASTNYVSIFDPAATSSAGDQCQGLSLTSLPAGWNYHCAASSTYKNTDGTGWIPINFSVLATRSPISILPIDPINTSSTGYYYTYTQSAGTYELTASLESQKYALLRTTDGGSYTDLYETGSNLALAPVDYAGGGGGGGGHNGYTYARAITMSGSNVSGTLSSFPMLFSGTYSYLAASSSAGNVQSSNGYDIIFASDSGCSSKLNFEQESYTNSSGAIVDWVNVPSITGGTVIYLCYGNASVTTSQQNIAGTWNGNYAGVWHLPNGTALSANDSTGNGNNGTLVNTPTATTGKIGGGANFVSASSQNITASAIASLGGATHAVLSGWFKRSGTFQGVAWGESGSSKGTRFSIVGDTGGGIDAYAENSSGLDEYGSFFLNDALWHYVVMVYDGTQSTNATRLVVYLDGAPQTLSFSGSGIPASLNSVSTFYFGQSPANFLYSDGALDEIRLTTGVGLSSQWVLTEFNNQSSPSTFYSVGAAM
jgi:prepilin-type N-terminal cleavage/methylation domain-containing protein